MNQQVSALLGITLIVVRNRKGEYLAVLETKNRGWWLPGGRVDPPESYHSAALRETKEEAGLDVKLVGILRAEYQPGHHFQRFKMVYFAIPIDENQPPKSIADKESVLAKWIPFEGLSKIKNWRGEELLEWAAYLEQGGIILPLSFLAEEGAPVAKEQFFTVKDIKF